MRQYDVVIVGAGPSGLNVALWLVKLGTKNILIVDKMDVRSDAAKAVGVNERTLLHYCNLGIHEQIIKNGRRCHDFSVWYRGRQVATMNTCNSLLKPIPYTLCISQKCHEDILIEHLAKYNVNVTRGTELVNLDNSRSDDFVTLTFRGGDLGKLHHEQLDQQISEPHDTLSPDDDDGQVFIDASPAASPALTTVAAKYVVACDGAHSACRKLLDLSFDGFCYPYTVFVSDVTAYGAADNGHANLSLGSRPLMTVPLNEKGNMRMLSVLPDSDGNFKRCPPQSTVPLESIDEFETMAKRMETEFHTYVQQSHSFSVYKIHRRIVKPGLKVGSVFFVGDAAHLATPYQAMGMNTGIDEAANLAWKLHHVLTNPMSTEDSEKLLQSYHDERYPIAEQMLENSHQGFVRVVASGLYGFFLRCIFLLVLMSGLHTVFNNPAGTSRSICPGTSLEERYFCRSGQDGEKQAKQAPLSGSLVDRKSYWIQVLYNLRGRWLRFYRRAYLEDCLRDIPLVGTWLSFTLKTLCLPLRIMKESKRSLLNGLHKIEMWLWLAWIKISEFLPSICSAALETCINALSKGIAVCIRKVLKFGQTYHNRLRAWYELQKHLQLFVKSILYIVELAGSTFSNTLDRFLHTPPGISPGETFPLIQASSLSWKLFFFGTEEQYDQLLKDFTFAAFVGLVGLDLDNVHYVKFQRFHITQGLRQGHFYLVRPDGVVSATGRITPTIASWLYDHYKDFRLVEPDFVKATRK